MKVTKLLRDPDAIEDGVWVQAEPDHPEFEVRARTRGPEFRREVEKATARLTARHGSRVPPLVQQAEEARLLFRHCIVEFRGLDGHDGEPLPREEAERLCGTFEGQPLYVAFLAAANLADARRAADAEDAEGNSPPASSGTSNGADTETS
jgi:hypothetical protein